jgi:hypothetical protein
MSSHFVLQKNSQYHYNYARCLYFLNRYAEARDHLMAVLRSFRGRLETPYQYAVRVLVPLLSFITEPPSDELLQLLNEADHWDSSVKSRILKDERIRIDYIFQFIIGELVKGGMSFPQSVPSCSHNRMYLLGESHILPLSWQQVNLGDMQYLLSPMLVMGLKAYLFSSNAPECKEKSTLHSHLQNIPVNSLCLVVAGNASLTHLSIKHITGEIDCRHGVGIAKAMEHGKYSNIEDAICETVEGYLAGLSKLSYEKNLTFFVHCVRPPLPPRHTNRAPLTYAQLEQEKLRILLFNQALRQGIQRLKSSRIILLDLYEQLSDEEGWMKLEYKNDDMHMNYKYLPVLQKALSESHWDAKAQNDAKETTTNTVLLHMLYS